MAPGESALTGRPMRNQRMIAEGAAPDFVIAFPGGLGTADMVERAKAAGVEVIETLARLLFEDPDVPLYMSGAAADALDERRLDLARTWP